MFMFFTFSVKKLWERNSNAHNAELLRKNIGKEKKEAKLLF